MQRHTRIVGIAIAILFSAAILVLTYALATGARWKANSPQTCPHEAGLRTYKQWRQGVTFPYVAQDSLRRVKSNYDRVGLGSSREDVIAAFGAPDFEFEEYSKVPAGTCVGYDFRYYFEKPADEANTLNDKLLDVFFTPTGKADWIVGNVGLPDKGGPGQQP